MLAMKTMENLSLLSYNVWFGISEQDYMSHKYTYASKTNHHIQTNGRNTSKRYDRVYKHSSTYKVADFKLFGTQRPQSDHYGVLVKIELQR